MTSANIHPDLRRDLEDVDSSELEAASNILLRTRIINAYEKHMPARIITLDNGPVSEVVFPINERWICYLRIITDQYKFRAVNLKTGYMTDLCATWDELQAAIADSWPPSAI